MTAALRPSICNLPFDEPLPLPALAEPRV